MDSKIKKNAIVWLHLSDLHYCEPKTGWDMHRVLDPLLIDLKAMETDHGLRPDLIFFTGDAAFGNFGSGLGSTMAEQYQQVEKFFSSVRQAFSVEVPKENLFLTPGNHDVDRVEATDALNSWLEQQQSVEPITNQIRTCNTQWKQFMSRLNEYRKFLDDNGYRHLLSDPERLVYSEIREFHGIKFGIGGFNSAWSSYRDHEKGKLWLGGDWQNGQLIKELKSKHAEIKLALIHHPPNWFVEHEDNKTWRQMERDFHFFLHGHEHLGWVNIGNACHVRIGAAACYERADQENGYNFVRLNLESGEIEIWLRKYDNDGGGWIPRIIKNKTDNNGLWLISNCSRYKLIKDPDQNGGIGPKNIPRPPTNLSISNQVRLEVRLEVKKLIQLSLLEEIVKALKEIQTIDKKNLAPEEILVPLDIEPFPIIETLDDWHIAVENGLKNLSRLYPTQLKGAAGIAKEIMEWLLRLAVPDNWVVSNPNITSELKPNKSILENYPIWGELGKGRLTGIRPFLELDQDNFHIYAPHQFSHDELEPGLNDQDALAKLLQMIWKKVELSEPPIDQDWRTQLPIILEKRKRRGEQRYHFSIPYQYFANISNHGVWKQLEKVLESLNIFVCGMKTGYPVLIVPEDKLMVEIREFLRVIGKYK